MNNTNTMNIENTSININIITTCTPLDVLNGRGQKVQSHPGNVKYRTLVFVNKVSHQTQTRHQRRYRIDIEIKDAETDGGLNKYKNGLRIVGLYFCDTDQTAQSSLHGFMLTLLMLMFEFDCIFVVMIMRSQAHDITMSYE